MAISFLLTSPRHIDSQIVQQSFVQEEEEGRWRSNKREEGECRLDNLLNWHLGVHHRLADVDKLFTALGQQLSPFN